MGDNPSQFKTCGSNCPVETVSWNDCQEFIKRLNGLVSGGGFRLPTEAEWEYAAGERTSWPYIGNLFAMATYRSNSGKKLHPVAKKRPNAWGLYDMHGNLFEWLQDWYGNYPSDSVTDSMKPSQGADLVFRGGSWNNLARNCPSGLRLGHTSDHRDSRLGLRLARTH